MAQSFSTLANDTINVFKKSYNLGKWLTKFSRFSPEGYDFTKLSRIEVNIIKSNMKPVKAMVEQNTGGIKESRGDINSLTSNTKMQIRRSNSLLKDKLARLKSFEKILNHEQLQVLAKASNSQTICWRILNDNRRVFMEAFRFGDLVTDKLSSAVVDDDTKQQRASILLIQIIYYLLTLRLLLSTTVLKLIDSSITMLTDKGDFSETVDFQSVLKLMNYEDIMFSNKGVSQFIKRHTVKEGRSFAQFLNYSIDTQYYKTIIAMLRRHSELAQLDYDDRTDKLLNFIASRNKYKKPGINADQKDLSKLLEYAPVWKEYEEFKSVEFVLAENHYTKEDTDMFAREGIADFLGASAAVGGGMGALVTGLSNPVGWILLGIFGVFSIKYLIHFYFFMEDWISSVLEDLDELNALLKVRKSDRHSKLATNDLIKKINNNTRSKIKDVETIPNIEKVSNTSVKEIEQAEETADATPSGSFGHDDQAELTNGLTI